MTIGDQPTTIRMVLHISELMISVDSDDQFSQCLRFFPGQKVKDSLQVIGEGFFDLAKKFALVRIPQVWTEFDGPPFDLFNERLGEFRRFLGPGCAEAGQEKKRSYEYGRFHGIWENFRYEGQSGRCWQAPPDHRFQ